MKLWLISQKANCGYDTYDSAVVAADEIEEARRTHPGGIYQWDGAEWSRPNPSGYVSKEGELGATWAHPSHVHIELIGDAAPDTKAGVICASFNAG